MPLKEILQLKLLGKMFSEHALAMLERVESLEHWSNQQDILLTGLMKTMSNHMLERPGINTDSKAIEDI